MATTAANTRPDDCTSASCLLDRFYGIGVNNKEETKGMLKKIFWFIWFIVASILSSIGLVLPVRFLPT